MALTKSFPGSVYMTPDRSSAIFLSPNDCCILMNVIGRLADEPITEGPTLNPVVLRKLHGLLGEFRIPVSEDSLPTVLSRELALYLETIYAQIIIRTTLSAKLQLTCEECGLVWIDDPGHLAQRQAESRRARVSAGIIDAIAIAGLIEGHHPLLASIRGYGAITRNQPNNDLMCNRCRGRELDRKHVSFCPNCRELRTETILLECPDCAYDFMSRSYGQFWTTTTEAFDRFKVGYKQVTISETVSSLYKHVRRSQVNDLVSEISPSERLLGICRCGTVANRGGDTIILFTSEKIVWTTRGPSDSERQSVRWNQIREISGGSERPGDAWIKLTNGNTVVFGAFVGRGADMSASNLSFGPDGIRDTMRQMLQSSMTVA